MRNIFLEKSYAKCGAIVLQKVKTEHISRSIVLSFISHVEDYRNKTVDHLLLPQNFLKNRKRSRASLPALFSA